MFDISWEGGDSKRYRYFVGYSICNMYDIWSMRNMVVKDSENMRL